MWFNILKVEDIDFDNTIEAFGQYMAESKDLSEEGVLDSLLALREKGELKFENFFDEKIRVNPQMINEFLTHKLEREPTEKESMAYIIRVIMHEATHAGMKFEQQSMTTAQAEYGAYTGQFPESTYLRLKNFIQHPASNPQIMPPFFIDIFGMKDVPTTRSTDRIKDILKTIDGITGPLPEGKRKGEIQEELTRLEMLAMKNNKPDISEDLINRTTNFRELIVAADKRWGRESVPLVEEIIEALKAHLNTGDEEKMAGAVSTASSPAMFGERYSNDEEDDDYA